MYILEDTTDPKTVETVAIWPLSTDIGPAYTSRKHQMLITCWANVYYVGPMLNLHLTLILFIYYNFSYFFMFDSSTNICKSWCLDTHYLLNNSDLVD